MLLNKKILGCYKFLGKLETIYKAYFLKNKAQFATTQLAR